MGDDVRGDDVQRLSLLVGDIYDAAIDPGVWPAALAGTAKFVGGPAARRRYRRARGPAPRRSPARR
jgi:hypothetical protein